MNRIKEFLYPLTSVTAIASVFGIGFVLIAVGAFINMLNPEFDYMNAYDRWYPGYTVGVVGFGFFILHIAQRLIGGFIRQGKSTSTRSLTTEKVVSTIDFLAQGKVWLYLVAAALIYSLGIILEWIWVESLGGISIVLISGLLMWKLTNRQ